MNIEESGEQLTSVQDIYRTLKSLEITRSQLTIKIAGDRHSYASLVIHTDLKNRQFVIDELVSDSGNQRIARGEPFTIIAIYQGVQVILKGFRAVPKGRQTFTAAHTLDFPPYLYHKQRRNAFRATLRFGITSHIILRSHNRQQALEGQLTDLSTTGVGCAFSGYVKPGIERQELFQNCFLKISGEFELHCGLVAKHPIYHKALDRYSCGFAYYNLDRHQQKAVDRHVLAIQRQARQHRNQREHSSAYG